PAHGSGAAGIGDPKPGAGRHRDRRARRIRFDGPPPWRRHPLRDRALLPRRPRSGWPRPARRRVRPRGLRPRANHRWPTLRPYRLSALRSYSLITSITTRIVLLAIVEKGGTTGTFFRTTERAMHP